MSTQLHSKLHVNKYCEFNIYALSPGGYWSYYKCQYCNTRHDFQAIEKGHNFGFWFGNLLLDIYFI